MNNIQISKKLFWDLLEFHLLEKYEKSDDIQKALNEKLDRMVMHDIYTKSKTAATEKEREKARQEYLDRVGMHPDFRW